MKKLIKILLIFVVMITLCVSIFSACSSPEGDNNTQNNTTDNNGIKHYELELNKDNFAEFLEYKITTVYTSTVTYTKDTFCEINGVLSYAYYKDVTVSFSVDYTNSANQTAYTGSFTVKLNAAGNYSFYTKEKAAAMQGLNLNYESIILTDVSGVIIFDI